MSEEDLRDFLSRKGGMEIIIKINQNKGSIQKELAEKINISEPSLSHKLDRAVKMDLVEETRLPEDHGNAKRYQLSSKGKKIYNEFEEKDLISKYERKKKLESDINKGVEEIFQRLDDILKIDIDFGSTAISDPVPITEDEVSDEDAVLDTSQNKDTEFRKKNEDFDSNDLED